jgi:hypothetical protein
MTDEEQLKALEDKWKGKKPERGSKEYADMILDRIRYRRIRARMPKPNIVDEAKRIFEV